MQEFFTISGYLIAGAFALYTQYSKQKTQSKTEDDKVASNLINNLKITVDQQEKALKDTNIKLEQTTKDLHLMQGRNSVLEGLFNGNENSILAFLKQAPQLMEVASENHKLAVASNEALTNLTNTMNNFLLHIMPLMDKPLIPKPVTSEPVQI